MCGINGLRASPHPRRAGAPFANTSGTKAQRRTTSRYPTVPHARSRAVPRSRALARLLFVLLLDALAALAALAALV